MRDLRAILDAVLDGVIVIAADGRVEQVNAAACRLLELSPEAVQGAPVDRLLGPDHPVLALVADAIQTGRSAEACDVVIERRVLRDAVVDLAVSPLLDADQQLDGAVLRLHDRTLQLELRNRAQERDRLEVFGRIALGIAHEVKNPLGGIRGASELLAARVEDGKARRTAELIVRESDRISGLLDDLMVFGRNDKLQLAPTNLHRVLDDVADLLVHDPAARGRQLERAYDPSIPELLADADRLRQVFLNLGRNALQAMEEQGDGGTLTLRTRAAIDHRLSAETGEVLPTLIVEVQDTGPGIPEELRDKVAIPFFSTRAQGTGLGIAISQHWVSQHGGVLRLLDAPNGGTCARVELPFRRVS